MTTTEQRLADALRECAEYLAAHLEEGSEHRVIVAADEALSAYDAQQAMTPADKLTVYPDSSTNKTGHAILANGVTVAQFVPAEWAPRIVQCVNAHDTLVSALRTILADKGSASFNDDLEAYDAAIQTAREALAQAGVHHA